MTGDDPARCYELFGKFQEQMPEGILNPYDLYRMIPDEEQNTAGMTNEELMKRPGLCLAKTHPWLKWRKDAYRIYQ